MNAGRIGLRVGALLLIPTALTHLAKQLDFYGPVRAMGLPLESLDVGPFAYEAKIIWIAGALLLALALLAPQRTSPIVMAVCAGGVLWTGYLYTRLQWTRLFAPLEFAQQEAPSPLAWLLGAALLLLGVAFVVVDALLQTREAQLARGLPDDQVAQAQRAAARAGAWVVGAALAGATALGFFYQGVRLVAATTEVRVNPVATLLVLGGVLAVLLWFALRKRSPLDQA